MKLIMKVSLTIKSRSIIEMFGFCFRFRGCVSKRSCGRWTSSPTPFWAIRREGFGISTPWGTSTSSTETGRPSTPSSTTTRVEGGSGGRSTYPLTSSPKRSSSTSWANWLPTTSGNSLLTVTQISIDHILNLTDFFCFSLVMEKLETNCSIYNNMKIVL